MNMTTFYFNTGVQPHSLGENPWRNNPPYKLSKGHVLRGTVQIPFQCADVPDKAEFRFACDNPNLPEASLPCFVVREIHDSVMVSKYAYFFVRS
jgi:hypothetical protein